jgi:F-type H+-transporting ATPase subunit b
MNFFGIEVDATFVALVGFALFIGLMLFLKVPGMVMTSLDQRSQAIAKELHDARRLREEAEALLIEYKAKQAAAETEAQTIVAAAKEQAEAMAADIRAQMQAAMVRREQQAKDRIAQAEQKATAEVRAAAAEAAIAAAERLLRQRMTPEAQARLIADGAKELARKFG